MYATLPITSLLHLSLIFQPLFFKVNNPSLSQFFPYLYCGHTLGRTAFVLCTLEIKYKFL